MSTPAPKRPRTDDGPTPATTAASRPHGKVVLDVGGTKFVSSQTTLESASDYFRALLARWDESAEGPIFIDADADAFQVLLSYMRTGTLMLPEQDEALCARALLHAEYLGMEALLREVKSRAYANMHPGTVLDDARPAWVAFDEDVGAGMADAIKSKVLPKRLFEPAPAAPPPPPERVVKALLPAPTGCRALYTRGSKFDHGRAEGDEDEEDEDEEAPSEEVDVVSFALVEHRDGTQAVDAVVQRRLDSTHGEPHISVREAGRTKSHMCFASEYRPYGDPGDDPYSHYMILPPRAPGQLLPIPPGSVRGLWRKPAFTNADKGKMVTIMGNTVKVGSEARRVEWDGDAPAPENWTDVECLGVMPHNDAEGRQVVRFQGDRSFPMPNLLGAETMEVDLAFASVESQSESEGLEARFFMPVSTGKPGAYNAAHLGMAHHLEDARRVTLDGMVFSHFLGAKRQ